MKKRTGGRIKSRVPGLPDGKPMGGTSAPGGYLINGKKGCDVGERIKRGKFMEHDVTHQKTRKELDRSGGTPAGRKKGGSHR